MKHQQRHFESDGNGGLYVSKKFLAILIMITTLLASFASVVVYAQTIRTDVSQLQKDTMQIQSQQVTQDNLLRDHAVDDATMKTQLENMQKDLSEIKADVKALRRP